ncbi:MAG: hypothetical protein K0U62_05240 [Actinomycetia bacterium]|nr:hypothetical protein [Actinomycetes bacterium]
MLSADSGRTQDLAAPDASRLGAIRDTCGVEPVLWLVAPVLVTVIVAALLLWRDRAPSPADAQELQREKLTRIEQVLRPDEQSDPR